MFKKISKIARNELLEAVQQRYVISSKQEKSVILNELAKMLHIHRKHTIRLLHRSLNINTENPKIGARIYNESIKEALIIIWEVADRICGKRLVAILPVLINTMEAHGHIVLDPVVKKCLFSISAATIDRLLSPMKRDCHKNKRRSEANYVRRKIQIRTFADWENVGPGNFEIDFVLHHGGSISGSMIHSLVVTDVYSGWIESIPLLAREQSLVTEGLSAIRDQLPMEIKSINSDNDSAFINDTVINYCMDNEINFTRSRPSRKNDQAWIEQKNGSVIRRFVGYERFSGPLACKLLSRLYHNMRLYVNFFQPSFKLLKKQRNGAHVRKIYDCPQTPCDRLLNHPEIKAEKKDALEEQRKKLDPVIILHEIRNLQEALAAMVSQISTKVDNIKSLDKFLAALPTLWKEEQSRPMHRQRELQKRYWRTRVDPFENMWPEILLLLEKNPDITAKLIFQIIQEKYNYQFMEGQLRTLQRRVKEWRKIMARELVYTSQSETD